MSSKIIYDHEAYPDKPTGQVVSVDDEIGPGGGYHRYFVYGKDDGNVYIDVRFQKGPVLEEGINGIQNEHLMAIVKHRLESFQSGPFSCQENQNALDSVNKALDFMHSRTSDRVDRGVEGQNKE